MYTCVLFLCFFLSQSHTAHTRAQVYGIIVEIAAKKMDKRKDKLREEQVV